MACPQAAERAKIAYAMGCCGAEKPGDSLRAPGQKQRKLLREDSVVPTYVYGCQECGAQFEQFQRFSDEPLTICPRCQGSIRRIFQPVGIVFKGGGWYVTDSRSNNSAATAATKSEAKAGGDDAAAPAKAAEGGDSAKPAASETKAAASESKPAASAA
jgi:putative FmdB family regulatory protein